MASIIEDGSSERLEDEFSTTKKYICVPLVWCCKNSGIFLLK